MDGTVKIWDMVKGQEMVTLKGLTGISVVQEIRPDGSIVSKFNPGSRKTAGFPGGPGEGPCLSPNGQRLAIAGMDGTVTVWDAVTGRELLTFQKPSGSPRRLCFSPDGSAPGQRQQRRESDRVECPDRPGVAHSPGAGKGMVQGVCFSPDGQRLAGSARDGRCVG